jgi:hypothetical protein
MSIPESVIEAAFYGVMNPKELYKTREARARRVILALAEDTPADAVWEAKAYLRNYCGVDLHDDEVLATIITFLKHVAGDSP